MKLKTSSKKQAKLFNQVYSLVFSGVADYVTEAVRRATDGYCKIVPPIVNGEITNKVHDTCGFTVTRLWTREQLERETDGR